VFEGVPVTTYIPGGDQAEIDALMRGEQLGTLAGSAIVGGALLGGALLGGSGAAVTEAALLKAAAAGGPTVAVVTRLSSRPVVGRALSVATGKGAEALANAARTGGQLFRANIPQGLLSQLESAGLATRSITRMGGVGGVEIRFSAAASRYVAPFFE
jgi:hypothetical protein